MGLLLWEMIKVLDTPLTDLGGQFVRFSTQLKKLGILTVRDLLWYLPIKIEDYSRVVRLKDLAMWPNQTLTVEARINKVKIFHTRNPRFRTIVEAELEDASGKAEAVWFNLYMIAKSLQPGATYHLAGKVAQMRGRFVLSHPSYKMSDSKNTLMDLDGGEAGLIGKIVPIYRETRGLTSRGITYLISSLLDKLEELPDSLPNEITSRYKLPKINSALGSIHRPKNKEEWTTALRRFHFEDLFYLQIQNHLRRTDQAKEKSFPLPISVERIKKILPELPYPLTHDQKKSLWEIMQDMGRPYPMNRLLQGDVGSGKTVVAVLAALLAHESKLTTAFLAPTEILAQQHYQTIKKIMGQIQTPRTPAIALLTGSGAQVKVGKHTEIKMPKPRILKMVSEGEVAILVGTHALIQKNISFKNLGLVVVDEQHRFGVRQRGELISRDSAKSPHLLSMSATPIPRTLALTIYGDLDISVIQELPKGRKKIITRIVSKDKRSEAYQFVREQAQNGRQIFVICPRIESGRSNDLGLISPENTEKEELKTVNEEYQKLSSKIFPDLKVAKLHGQMRPEEKEKIMADFQKGKIDILVATSVVEVGVDIPNASVMWIEGADRFGLAQLYQFRGRVGRGEHQSYCLLFSETDSPTGRERLEAIVSAKNGLELAELDLKLRGPGELLGNKQSGLGDEIMKAIQNAELIKQSREAAEGVLKSSGNLKKFYDFKKELDRRKMPQHLE